MTPATTGMSVRYTLRASRCPSRRNERTAVNIGVVAPMACTFFRRKAGNQTRAHRGGHNAFVTRTLRISPTYTHCRLDIAQPWFVRQAAPHLVEGHRDELEADVAEHHAEAEHQRQHGDLAKLPGAGDVLHGDHPRRRQQRRQQRARDHVPSCDSSARLILAAEKECHCDLNGIQTLGTTTPAWRGFAFCSLDHSGYNSTRDSPERQEDRPPEAKAAEHVLVQQQQPDV